MKRIGCFRISLEEVASLKPLIDELEWAAWAEWVQEFGPQVDGVIQQLREAFADVKLGSGIGLFQAEGLDDYACDEELQRLRERDEKENWQRIPLQDLKQCLSAPAFMDARGFLFHLPALIIAELNDQYPMDFIAFYLLRDGASTLGWREWLTRDQRLALAQVFRLIRTHPHFCNPIVLEEDDGIETIVGQLEMDTPVKGESTGSPNDLKGNGQK